MMHPFITRLAAALRIAGNGKSSAETDAMAARAYELLRELNLGRRMPELIAETARLNREEKNIGYAAVSSARELSGRVLTLIQKFVMRETGVSDVEVETKIDPLQLGGFKIKFDGDRVVDATVAGRIKSLTKHLEI